jgi:tRNA-specific 2-thiouridylase
MWREASRCCGEDDIYRAQRVCHMLGIPHFVIDLTREFGKHVVDSFVDSYSAGLTPNPCAICNREIKFGAMLERALRLGFERVASGHYARLRAAGGRPVLAEPEDVRKSQVYFLSLVRQDALAKIEFPLADHVKRDVVDMVRSAGLPVRDGESQDLCFAAPGRHGDILRSRGSSPGPGNILDLEGSIVGRHGGHPAYTVGQRLGIKGKRLYVVRKDALANEVTVGHRARAMASRLRAGSVNFFLGVETNGRDVVLVKCRHNSPAARGRLVARSEDGISVVLDEPYFAPAPGQILACYRDDSVVCAGVIEEALP